MGERVGRGWGEGGEGRRGEREERGRGQGEGLFFYDNSKIYYGI